jgi:hypothetical protein
VDPEATVLIVSAYNGSLNGEFAELVKGEAVKDRFGKHRLADDAASADMILFVERWISRYDPSFSVLRSHPWLKQYPTKCFMYNQEDRPWQVLPGLYCSMPARLFDPRRQRACSYLGVLNEQIGRVEVAPQETDLLFSFVGGRHARVRDDILKVRHPRVVVRDTTGELGFEIPEPLKMRRREEYADIVRLSRFIVCPRGHGTSTFRLFEAMESARAPVILSDDWVPPAGPPWPEFSLRVPEAAASSLPLILEAAEEHWIEMGQRARQAWLEWFSPTVRFHRMIEDCVSLAAGGCAPRRGVSALLARDRVEHRVERAAAPWRRFGRKIGRRWKRLGTRRS